MSEEELKNAARSSLTPRSPPKKSTPLKITSDEVFLSPFTPTAKNDLKRKADEKIEKCGEKQGKIEKSNDDLYNIILNLGSQLSNDIKNECGAIKNELSNKMDEKFERLNKDIDEMKGKIVELDVNVDKQGRRLDQQDKILNRMLQEKLKNKMEISGVSLPYQNDRSKTKDEAIKIISKFGIRIENESIKSAHVRNTKNNKDGETQKHQIITVEFNDFETKLRVLKEKRRSTQKNGIYFDDALTPTNKFLIGKAKKLAKEKNFMMYFSNNRINVKKSESKIKWIENESDLQEVREWTPNEEKQKKEDKPSTSQESSSKA